MGLGVSILLIETVKGRSWWTFVGERRQFSDDTRDWIGEKLVCLGDRRVMMGTF